MSETRYAVRYWSKSKGREIDLEELNDFHLVAARNKLKRELDEEGTFADENGLALIISLALELKRRGLDPAFKGGKPPEEK